MTWLDRARAADCPTPEEVLRRAMASAPRYPERVPLILDVTLLRGAAGRAAKAVQA